MQFFQVLMKMMDFSVVKLVFDSGRRILMQKCYGLVLLMCVVFISLGGMVWQNCRNRKVFVVDVINGKDRFVQVLIRLIDGIVCCLFRFSVCNRLCSGLNKLEVVVQVGMMCIFSGSSRVLNSKIRIRFWQCGWKQVIVKVVIEDSSSLLDIIRVVISRLLKRWCYRLMCCVILCRLFGSVLFGMSGMFWLIYCWLEMLVEYRIRYSGFKVSIMFSFRMQQVSVVMCGWCFIIVLFFGGRSVAVIL